MSVISLITDFGQGDNFVGVMKGVILRINPGAKIVDICNGVNPQDILTAALLLKSSFRYFPKGTVHLVVVDPGVGSARRKILAKTKDYFFIAPDNGVLSAALEGCTLLKVIDITNKRYFLESVSDTFHGRDIFAPVAAYLSRGTDIGKFGKAAGSIKALKLPRAKKSRRCLTGEIIHIDRFGNLVSDIDREAFNSFIKDKKFSILIKGKTIDKLSRSYAEGAPLEPLALIGSFNYLEIALNRNSASDLLKARIGTEVRVVLAG